MHGVAACCNAAWSNVVVVVAVAAVVVVVQDLDQHTRQSTAGQGTVDMIVQWNRMVPMMVQVGWSPFEWSGDLTGTQPSHHSPSDRRWEVQTLGLRR
jgi:hypothetical protein